MRRPARPFRQLSAVEAARALYIDFEGVTARPPVLLGVLRRPGRGSEPAVRQMVVDAVFEPLGPAGRELRAAVEDVVRRAEAHDRRIVSWSEHDLDVVRRLRDDDPALVDRFEARYANARAVAKGWASRLYPAARPARGALAGYLGLVGYTVPAAAGPGHVGSTIRAIRPTLDAGRAPTPRQRERWARLLEHNRHDCAGMRAVCIRATRELEADDAARARRVGRRERRRARRRRRLRSGG
jgi:hypothetical protein